MKFPISLIIFLISLSITGCFSIKPGTEKTGKKLYETFYLGDEGTQYFIKPLDFKAASLTDLINLDFTFRYKTDLNSIVVVNFSILNDLMIKKIDSLKIENSFCKIICQNNKLLFSEKLKDGFVSRYSSKVSLKELNSIVKEEDWIVKVFNDGIEYSYSSTKRTKNAIKKLNKRVFTVFS